jgi:hypothetical protein
MQADRPLDKRIPSMALKKTLTQPLYEIFDFYDIPSNVVREELLKMRGTNLT